MNRKHFSLTALLIAAPLALVGCAGASADTTPAPASEQRSSGALDAATVTMIDGWAKSAEEGGMTGVFGTLENSGDEDLVIASVESPAAGLVELHEVLESGTMQEIVGDVTIPADGALELAPGANHIMLMELRHNLLAGEDVDFIVTFTNGGSIEVTVPIKDYSGANEEYGDLAHHDHGDGDHGDHGDHEH
ncbi:MAG: copper chaperone PCu(A)C [Leucobacter sp.]